MFITKKHLSRRHMLRSLGAGMALPFLDAMVPAATALATNHSRRWVTAPQAQRSVLCSALLVQHGCGFRPKSGNNSPKRRTCISIIDFAAPMPENARLPKNTHS